MRVVSFRSCRSFVSRGRVVALMLAAAAATASLAHHLAHRAAPPVLHCELPPAAAPPLIEAVLVERPRVLAGCGTFLVETTMVFHPIDAPDGTLVRVLVPCAELPRAGFSPTAGDAGPLVRDRIYDLTLAPATDAPNGKNDTLWRAVRIDDTGR